MKANIRDVAKLAGVSIGTVSRAFNGYTDISPQTKKQIEKAARILNYRPNISARNLSAKKPPNIGLIVAGLLDVNPRDSNAYLLLQGVFDYAMRNHLEIALYATDSPEQRSNSFIEFCSSHNLSGTILSGISMSDPYLDELLESPIPIVSIDFPAGGESAGWVSIDNRAAMRDMAEQMITLGHRDFLVLAGKKDTAINEERLQGLEDAFAASHIPFERESALYADFSEEKAYAMMKDYLAVRSGLPVSCVLCFSDIMAMGAMRALKEAGLRIPRDVSVTGFDDLPIAVYTDPPLTSVRQDMRQLGSEAAAMLHTMMSKGKAGEHRVLPYSLTLRGSSAAPGMK